MTEIIYNYEGKPITLETINPKPQPLDNSQRPFEWREEPESPFSTPLNDDFLEQQPLPF